jgi:hypothetical protein
MMAKSAVEAPGHHVAGILLVARGIGDDELAPVGGEEAVGDVDGDALLALRAEAVDEKGEIELVALGAGLPAVRLERGELVLEDHLAVVEQAPEQGRLAVVDGAAGQQAEQRFFLTGVGGGVVAGRRPSGGWAPSG